MRFKIREPFSVHLEKVIERSDGAGRKVKEGKIESHFSGDEIEITETEARKHLHKLEPVDAEARKVLDGEYEKNRQIRDNFQRTGEQSIGELVAAEVAKALAAAGVTAAKGR